MQLVVAGCAGNVSFMERTVDAKYVGAQVRQARERKGWSLQRLSAELQEIRDPGKPEGGCITAGRAAVGKWESGDTQVPVRYLIPLANLLDVTPNWLLLGDGSAAERAWTDRVLVGDTFYPLSEVWAWACGDAPLPGTQNLRDAQVVGRPHDSPSEIESDRLQVHPATQRLAAAASELRREGASLRDIKFFLDVWQNMTTVVPNLQWDSESGRPTFGDEGR